MPQSAAPAGLPRTPGDAIAAEALVGPLVKGLAVVSRRLDSRELLRTMITEVFPGRIAVVTAFGAESAVLLDLVAQIDKSLPVVFLETGKHFPETLAYRDALVARLGLSDVRSITPDAEAIARHDPAGDLWSRDPDRCCALRKVAPLDQALAGFDAWITGRKRFQASTRQDIETIEFVDGKVKLNPLAHWSRGDIEAAMIDRALPRHPLVKEGYRSIGCATCTRRVGDGSDDRDGRWGGLAKTECGIHKAPWARQ